jgi:hypothetical protein
VVELSYFVIRYYEFCHAEAELFAGERVPAHLMEGANCWEGWENIFRICAVWWLTPIIENDDGENGRRLLVTVCWEWNLDILLGEGRAQNIGRVHRTSSRSHPIGINGCLHRLT